MTIGSTSRYRRSTKIVIQDSQGNPTKPPYMDLIRRLQTTAYRDNQTFVVVASDSFPSLGLRMLGFAPAWDAVAEFSQVVDPFSELVDGVIMVAPSTNTYHFILVGETVS